MNDILADKKLDRKYLEKFSQLQIRMPAISEEKKKEIAEKCIKNYLKDEKAANELIETI